MLRGVITGRAAALAGRSLWAGAATRRAGPLQAAGAARAFSGAADRTLLPAAAREAYPRLPWQENGGPASLESPGQRAWALKRD